MAERSLTACRQKLARYRVLLDEGVEPGVVAGWIGEVTAERTLTETRLRDLERTRPVFSAAEIEETVLALGGLTDVLQRADPELRARLYGQLGLEVVCDPDKRQVTVKIEVCKGTVRVGGASLTQSTRAAWNVSLVAA